MKNIVYFLVIAMLISCGGSDGDDTPNPQQTNNAPSQPANIEPLNNVLCIDNILTFQWSASTDPDNDAVKYELQISKDNQFTQGLQSFVNLTTTSQQVSLEKGIAYYWKVKAIDSKSASSDFSTIFHFYTEGTGTLNYAPFVPELIAPKLHTVVTTITANLEWSATDVDGDALVFDVYFGIVNPPTAKIVENQSSKTKSVNLESGNEYFWKVVAKDNKGGETTGQIWRFKKD